MSGVLVGRPVILVAIVIGALGATPAWASRDSNAGSAPPTPLRLAASVAGIRFVPSDATTAGVLKRLAQSRITVSDAATEGDEVPNPAFIRKSRGAAATGSADIGGDEVPSVAAVTPAAPETPVATPQPAAAPAGGDEVPSSGGVPGMRRGTTDGGEAAPSPVAAPSVAPAAPPAAVAVPAAPVDPVVEQLRELAAGKFDRLWGGDKDKRAALDAFYSKRNYAPIWISDGAINDRARAAIEYLAHVDADGLNPADYVVPDVAAMTDPASLAEGEIKLSAAVVAYARHAQIGRVHWTRVSGDIFYDLKASPAADVLANLAGSGDVAAALAAYEPQTAGYLALKAKLAELRGGSNNALPGKIPPGPAPKVGAQDSRVPLVRQRLGVTGDPDVFDKTLSDAVKKFQQDSNLKASGTLDQATIDALNGRHPTPTRLIDLILANMERWRWMPHDLGKTYVLVNLTEYMLYVTHNGRPVWSTRIVDGKPETPTPIMSVDMKSITINPTWNIPDTIAAKEYVPMMRQDPTILERMGLTVTYNQNGTIHISQPPGPQNALGQLRFNLPNKFLVYQHDSNEKYLFSKPVRDTSHGCMRIENPVKYAEVILSIARPREAYTEDRIRGLFGNQEREIGLPTYIPVHVTYQTAFVDKDGRLQTREDIYGRDRALLAILKSDDRKVADVPIERRDNAVRREALAVPDQIWGGGGNIFNRLFGGFSAQPPRPPGRVH
jgi:murein L,D-transpeptidase YcbB/YkuD